MDPLTAYADCVTAIAKMITEIVEGQTPDQKAQIWAWFIEDTTRMRKFFKLDQ